MRIAIVGGGVAGALLALRLRYAAPRAVVELVGGDRPEDADATGASGGLVRGFEPAPTLCRLAAESLVELRGSAQLREWAAYREIGSVYLLPPGADPARSVTTVETLLPGSASVLDTAELDRRYPFRDLPAGTVGVRERHAGHLSPARLRAAVLASLAGSGVAPRRQRVAAVTTGPALRLAGGGVVDCDMVVVAAGAWTPRLLAGSGLGDSGLGDTGRGSGPGGGGPATAGLRSRQIQYSVHPVRVPGLGAFVDETTGLYGRPIGAGSFLLGLPTAIWDVDPATVRPDQRLADEVLACAHRRLGTPRTSHPSARTVASFDCYHDPPGLSLRRCSPDAPVFTFTGGSGGAAKTVLAASRRAAEELLAL